jgi:soluble lytic murein transglycosylase-like protein
MPDAVTPSTDCGSFEHTLIFPYRGSLKNAECSRGLQRKRHTHAWAGQAARLRSRGVIARIIVVIAPFVCQVAASTAFEVSARTQTATRYETIDRFAGFIAEASTRFAIPASWIRAVMQVESGGDERATSPRGAMGLMQLMPGTWVELSVRYGLGLDPFDASDNILAGTAYLKEMHDRFGSAGFLAAYHAGPARYEQHLATGQPLPPETIAYIAAVTPLLGDGQGEHAAVDGRRALPWREAPLFVERAGAP